MTTITHVADSAYAHGTAAPVIAALPTGWAAGDLFLVYGQTSNQDFTVTGGNCVWTACAALVGSGTAAAAGSVGIKVYWAIATSTATVPTVSDSGDHTIVGMAAFRGVDQTNPMDVTPVTATATTSTAVSIAAITTVSANCMVVGFVGNATDSVTVQNTTFTDASLASCTALTTTASNTTDGFGGGVTGGYGIKAVAGSSGAMTATLGTTSVQAKVMIALRPDLLGTTGAAVFRSMSTLGYSPGTGDSVINKPAGTVSGDLLVCILWAGQSGTGAPGVIVTPPAGWTAIANATNTFTLGAVYYSGMRTYYLIAGGSEPSTYTFAHATSDMDGCILCYNNVDLNNPIGPVSGNNADFSTNGLTPTITSITTIEDKSTVIFAVASWDSANASSPPSGTTPIYSARYDNNDPTFQGLYVADGLMSPAGATGADTITVVSPQTSSEPWFATAITIQPIVPVQAYPPRVRGFIPMLLR